MIIFSHTTGPRLRYIGDHISARLFGQPALYTNDAETFSRYEGVRLNYSTDRVSDNEIHIVPCGLLGETGIREQDPGVISGEQGKLLFGGPGDAGFDLPAACFYLVSRYEEYLSPGKDEYGRFDHRASLAFREGFLSEPIVDDWIMIFRKIVSERFPGQKSVDHDFVFLPTYDIDEPWSFRHKSFLINAGGMVKDLAGGRWSRVRERIAVRKGRRPDPFDAYDWMDALHARTGLKPVYFFLVAGRRSRYDRNTNPRHPAFRSLVQRHADRYDTGLHPSWQSIDPEILQEEKTYLEEVTGQQVFRSRQHYIRFTIPGTYRELIDAGITGEYSMGYGSVNGFRASTSVPFFWYDLEREQQTALKVIPFCFMDANSFFEQRQSPEEAIREMKTYFEKVKRVQGQFVSIWHNTFLGTDPLFGGWREAYMQFHDSLA